MSDHGEDDRGLTGVEALPVRDVDARTAEEVRRRARNLLAHERRLAARPWLRRADHVYGRYLEPALVAIATSAYLLWAVKVVMGLQP